HVGPELPAIAGAAAVVDLEHDESPMDQDGRELEVGRILRPAFHHVLLDSGAVDEDDDGPALLVPGRLLRRAVEEGPELLPVLRGEGDDARDDPAAARRSASLR